MQEYLEIGQIVNTQGLKGVVKVNPFTDDKKRFEKLKKIYVVQNTNLIEYAIQEVKYFKNQVLLKLKGIDSIEQAEKLKGLYLKIDKKDAIKLPKDTYFIADLLGMKVKTIEGEDLGYIDDIFPTGSNDVYVVKDKEGKQILIPAIQDVIRTIDLENKVMTIKLIEGLRE